MKKGFFLLYFAVCLFSCHDQDKEFYPTFKKVVLKSELKSIISNFLTQTNCKQCIIEFYVDVKNKNSNIDYTIVSRSYSKDYLKRNNPLFYFFENKQQIFLYSGLEEAFMGDGQYMKTNKSDSITSFNIWTIDYCNGRYVIDKKGLPPFLKNIVKKEDVVRFPK